MTVRIATRGTPLARWQAERVAALLDDDTELVIVTTTGDARPDTPIRAMSGTGVFVKEVEQALLDGHADIAVHSAKDLPSAPPPDGLLLAAFPERADVRDALVGSTLSALRPDAKVATGSVRRRAQLAAIHPALEFAELRGSIETRLEKAAGFDAVVIAAAALERLGLLERADELLAPSVMIPQVGQGALAVECRADDPATLERVTAINDAVVAREVSAERAFLAVLGGGCDLPVGALAVHDGDELVLQAVIASLDGHTVLRGNERGNDPELLGHVLARELLEHGGDELVAPWAAVTVYLVGAGPGDPGLLTVRGAEVLRRADVVVYDRLASPSLLTLAPAGAELVSAGKAPGAVELTQDAINALLVARGSAGATVVRLKGGDPYVFGRGGEEAEALAAAGVAFEVVPGITSAIAAAAYAGIPVTHRGLSTHFTVVTGHEDPAKQRTDVDWPALARSGGTLVILMGAGRIADIASALIDGGLAPDTPVAAVRNGTRPDQQTVRATLATVGSAGVRSPSAIVVGAVAALDLGWFEHRPLFGRSVVVTRAREQSSELAGVLATLGAEVLELPTIAIEPLEVTVPDLSAGWLVFTSTNGVDAFFDRGLTPAGRDTRALAAVRIAAIGPGTGRALASRGVAPDLVPERSVAEALLDAFPAPSRDGERAVIARAEQARDVLPEGLRARGYVVEVLPVYRTVPVAPDAAMLERVRAGDVDAITFTSSSTVTNLCDVVGPVPDPQPVVVSIGPVTSDAARARGLRVDAEADPHTIDGVVAALLAAFAESGERRRS